MTIRLVPNDEAQGDFEVSLGGWSQLLLAGPGLVIGFGHSITPGLIWESDYDDQGLSPQNSDGYKVRAEEAAAMALVAKGLVAIWEGGGKVFVDHEGNPARFKSHQPPNEARVQDMKRFAEWVGESGGFSVH